MKRELFGEEKISSALFTDLYELTMAYGYWKSGWEKKEALFYLYFRKEPFRGSYAVASGLETIIQFLEGFQFSSSDIAYLSSLKDSLQRPLFEKDFLTYLRNLKFSLDIDAVEEGDIVFAQEPLVRVKGPILQAQILESILLNGINFQTLIATKASRICFAAEGDEVIEFGMRRAQGYNGALSASRAAFIGGCRATSNVLAGKIFSIPVKGTMAHSWVMTFDKEEEAFTRFAEIFPGSAFFLVDTFDTKRGIEAAIRAARFLKKKKISLLGVRLDSGDLFSLSVYARKRFQEEGFFKVSIMASNELSEQKIQELKRKKAPISIWGVGTHLVTAKQQPALQGVYKLSCVQNERGVWENKVKISDQKQKSTFPGFLQVRRKYERGEMGADLLFDEREENIPPSFVKGRPLLVPIYRKGRLVYTLPSLANIQKRARQEVQTLPQELRQLFPKEKYTVKIAESLQSERERKRKELQL